MCIAEFFSSKFDIAMEEKKGLMMNSYIWLISNQHRSLVGINEWDTTDFNGIIVLIKETVT